jgi:ubiquitin-activating enzyme E1 C
VIGGLDSVTARTWINGRLVGIARESNGETVIPYIDGGTEEWKGHVKYILPNQTACLDCQQELFTPQVVYQDCTVASFPRQPEHAIIWAKEMEWKKVREGETVDGDNDEHIEWIYNKAVERAAEFKIEGVTVNLTKGVVKSIIPAIAASQAVIASMCVTEALKAITDCGPPVNNNLLYDGVRGAHLQHFLYERNPECPSCSRKLRTIPRVEGETVEQLFQRLRTDFNYPVGSLSANGVQIYLKLLPTTIANLKKPIAELTPPDAMFLATASGQDNFEFIWESA